jgi:hypothetical protein
VCGECVVMLWGWCRIDVVGIVWSVGDDVGNGCGCEFQMMLIVLFYCL